jgi:hypothetical protein
VNVPQRATANANDHTNNWLNAEVIDARHVSIYQYYPGGHATVWRLTKQGGVLRGDVDDNGDVNITDVTLLISYVLNNSGDINLANADCDSNDEISITDVTLLISAILSESYSGINFTNSDLSGDGILNVTDITMLISKVMSSR